LFGVFCDDIVPICLFHFSMEHLLHGCLEEFHFNTLFSSPFLKAWGGSEPDFLFKEVFSFTPQMVFPGFPAFAFFSAHVKLPRFSRI